MKRLQGRERRHKRIRKKLFGTPDRPRMVVYRSLRNLYVQLIDDTNNKTITSISTNTPEIRDRIGYGGNIKAAEQLGEYVAKKFKEKGIATVVFDRSGYRYHGRVKALAEAVKKHGLSFRTQSTNTDKK